MYAILLSAVPLKSYSFVLLSTWNSLSHCQNNVTKKVSGVFNI